MSTHNYIKEKKHHEKFVLLMRGLGTKSILYQQKVAISLGLYNHDFIAVDILRETGPITAGELSRLTHLTTGSVTALIDRLEKAGYVCREKDPNDRRKVIIVPQYEHKQEVKEQYYALHEKMVELASKYTEEELEFIIQFMEEANIVLEEKTRDDSFKS